VYAFSLGFDDTGPDNGLFVSTSTDGGVTWGSPVPVIVDRQFEFFNDKNALAADDWSSSPYRGNAYVAWDRLIEDPLGQPFVGTYTGPAMFSRSTDGGASFSTPQVVFETGTNKQTIGNVPVVFPNGHVAVLGTYFDNASLGKNSQSLWMTLSTDGGRTFTAPRLAMDMQSLPVPGLRTGDTVPAFAVAADGTLYATWQDVRFSHGKRTDVLVTSSHDEGQTWSTPRKANDTPAGAQDAFTPAIAVDARGRVGILYYDLRDDTSTKDGAFMTAEWLTTSTDGGRTWSASQRVTPTFDHAAAAQHRRGVTSWATTRAWTPPEQPSSRSSQRTWHCRRAGCSARTRSPRASGNYWRGHVVRRGTCATQDLTRASAAPSFM
jgi:Neuraminidase (sialidase)